MSLTIRILGLDIAAIHSGSAVVEAQVRPSGEMEFTVLHERPLTTTRVAPNQPPSWESMQAVADRVVSYIEEYEIKHVVYEGFAKGWGGRVGKNGKRQSANTTAYEHAELVGVIKDSLYRSSDLTFLQVPPTTMRSFYQLPPKDKKAIQRALKEKIGWSSTQRLAKERSDCSDAVAHCVIAGYVFAILDGWEGGRDLDHYHQRVLFGDPKKGSKMVGLLNQPNLYIPRDACVRLEETTDD